MRFLHAADVHLDSPLRGLARYEGAPVAALRGATRRAFTNLVDLALAEAVDFVLLAGDLYDGDWKDYNTGLFFTGQIGRLHEAGIPVFLIAGNHDAASQLTRALRPPPNLRVFATRAPETHRLETLGVAIHGQGFATRAVTEDLSRGYPDGDPALFNIGLLHTSLDGRPGHEPYAPCTLDGLRAKGYEYWALGHVHRREVVAEDPWVVYPGNLQGRHVRETGPKGCLLVEVVDGQVATVEPRVLDVVRWADRPVDVSTARTLDQLDPLLEAALATALAEANRDETASDEAPGAPSGSEGARQRLLAVRLRLVGETPLHALLHTAHEQALNDCRALIGARLAGEVWLERLLVETRPMVSRVRTGTTPPNAGHPNADQNVSGPPAVAPSDAPVPAPDDPPDDPLAGLLQAITDLGLDAERLAALAEEVEPLAHKLRPALRRGDDPFDPTDPALLQGCLEDVKALLRERLSAQAHTSADTRNGDR